MSKEYWKKRIVDLRAEMTKEKEAKKRDNERYANYIKNASSNSINFQQKSRSYTEQMLFS